MNTDTSVHTAATLSYHTDINPNTSSLQHICQHVTHQDCFLWNWTHCSSAFCFIFSSYFIFGHVW